MKFIYIFIGIMILIPLAQWLITVIKLYGMRLTRVRFKPLTSVKLSKANQQQFYLAQEQLKKLGFKFFHCHAYRDLIVSDNKPTVGMVLKNDHHQCYALITNPHNPDLNRPFGIRFQSFYQELTIEAMDADAEGIIKSFDQLHAFNNESKSLPTAFEEFLAQCETLEEEKNLNQLYYQRPEHYCQHMQRCYDQYLKHLFHAGVLVKKENAFQLRFSQAIKLAWQLMSQAKKQTAIKPDEAPTLVSKYAFLPQVQAQAHRKVQTNQQASQLGHWGKTLLFVLSAMMFALLFGLAWSPFLVLILIPVLLFHELGHYLAMKLFGYRDLQILFLPIGAMVAGKKKNPTPLQSTVVSLAGPVPGILLALALAIWAPDFIYNEYGLSMIFMLIIINYLNLLPFMPLDGGHVVNQLLFDRWPILQFALMLISVGLFALGAWAWSDPILAVLAVVFGLGLKGHYKQAQYVTTARVRWGAKLKNRDNLDVAYHLMKSDPAPFAEKYQAAAPINDRLSHPSPTLRDSLLGMLMYLTALIGPLVAVEKVVGFDVIALLFSATETTAEYDPEEAQRWDPEYWQTAYNQASSLKDKQAVLQEALRFTEESEESYTLGLLTSDAIELYENNGLQQDPDYIRWLKHHMMNHIYEDHEYQAEADLQKLAELMGENSLAYAKTLADVVSWQGSIELKTQLKNRLPLFVDEQDYETLLSALLALQPTEDESHLIADYQQLLIKYLPIFQTQAPDLYPGLKLNYWQTLFTQQRYQELLEMAKSTDFSPQPDVDNASSYEYELLAWTALLDHQYQLAETYQKKRRDIEQQQQEAIKEDLGFLAGMVLQDQDIYSAALSDPLFKLAIAVQKNDETLIANELDSYQAVIKTWQKTSFKEFLKKIEYFEQVDSHELHYIKYRFLFKAIRLVEPELYTNNQLNLEN